ncbi:MAG: hypothetical protein ABIR98_11160 [Usitatibacter sp.]
MNHDPPLRRALPLVLLGFLAGVGHWMLITAFLMARRRTSRPSRTCT